MSKSQVIDQETLSSMNQYTLPQILWKQANLLGTQTAFREKAYGAWRAYNWLEYLSFTKHAALGLVALGLKRHEKLALILDNHPEWLFGQLGCQSVGAVSFNLSTSESTENVVQWLNEVRASYLIVEDQAQVDGILAHRNQLPQVRRLVYVDPAGLGPYRDNPWLVGFGQLLELGEELDEEEPELFLKELWEGNSQDAAAVVPHGFGDKAPMWSTLSHRDCLNVCNRMLQEASGEVGGEWFSLFSPACLLEQIWGIAAALCRGMTVSFPETPETASEDLKEIKPTVLVAESGYWKELAGEIESKAKNGGGLKSRLYRLHLRVGSEVLDMSTGETPVPFRLRALRWFTSRTLARPLMGRLGLPRLQVAFSYQNGNACDRDLIRFFKISGVNLRSCPSPTDADGELDRWVAGAGEPDGTAAAGSAAALER